MSIYHRQFSITTAIGQWPTITEYQSILPGPTLSLVHRLFRRDILWEERLACSFAGSESTRQRELSGDTLNTVSRVDILNQGDLVTRGRTLAGDDGG